MGIHPFNFLGSDINTMYYVTCAIVEDVFVSLTHMSMNIMFLENVVGNLVNIITID
jgi:hypothetical protein